MHNPILRANAIQAPYVGSIPFIRSTRILAHKVRLLIILLFYLKVRCEE